MRQVTNDPESFSRKKKRISVALLLQFPAFEFYGFFKKKFVFSVAGKKYVQVCHGNSDRKSRVGGLEILKYFFQKLIM